MFWFIIALILLLIAAGIVLVNPTAEVGTGEYETEGYSRREKTQSVSYRWTFVIPLILGLLFLALSSVTVVGSRNIGVEKFMSATTGRTLEAGVHLKAPWNSVTDIDATIQPEEYDTEHPIKVKIGDQGEANVALAYRWRINPDGADEIYKDYRNAEDITAAVRSALVSTNIKAALNEELGTYNPLENVVIDAGMTPSQIAKVTIPPIPYGDLNDAVKRNLETKIADLGDLIEVQSVTISYIQLPESTQAKINEFNTKIQESKNALIDIATKQAQATANERLAKSVDESPNVLVSKCLDGLLDGSISNQPGFSCWPGGGSGVIVPGTK